MEMQGFYRKSPTGIEDSIPTVSYVSHWVKVGTRMQWRFLLLLLFLADTPACVKIDEVIYLFCLGDEFHPFKQSSVGQGYILVSCMSTYTGDGLNEIY
jgi:hypothetical protein